MKIIRSILLCWQLPSLPYIPYLEGCAGDRPCDGIGMLAFLGGAILVIRGRVKL